MAKWTYDECGRVSDGERIVAFGVSPADGPRIAAAPEMEDFLRRHMAFNGTELPVPDCLSPDCLWCNTARLLLRLDAGRAS